MIANFETLLKRKPTPRLISMAEEGIAMPWNKRFQINVASIPKRLKLTDSQIDEFMLDPVTGAEWLFKWKLDWMQKVRLKISWFTRRVMDSSGFSSAKTLNFFMVTNMRAILIQDHVSAVYYPTFPQGQKVYWVNFDKVARQSEVFRAHMGKRRIMGLDGKVEEEGRAQIKNPSYYEFSYKNSSVVYLLAGGFGTGSKSQAGLRFNTLGVDEWTKIEALSGADGISDQLVGRCTRASFNQFHPVWCNHQIFSATAEDVMHSGYDRYKSYADEVRKGNPDYALIWMSYKDWDRKRIIVNGHTFREEFGEESVLLDMKKNKTRAGFLQEGLGLWSKNGVGLYTRDLIDRAMEIGVERKIEPITCVAEDGNAARSYFFFSGDPAKADNLKADDGALMIGRATPKGEFETPNIHDWKFDFVWAYKVRKADATQWAAIMHRKGLQFPFAGWILDHGGGGQWIRPELMKEKHMIRDIETKVEPVCCEEDEQLAIIRAKPLLAMFRMGDAKVAKLWSELHLKNWDNMVDAAHTEFHQGFISGVIGFPQPLKKWPKEVTEGWHEEKKSALLLLETTMAQLMKISVLTGDDGKIARTKNNARQFSSKDRKDFAYAALMCYVRFLMWLKTHDSEFLGPKGEDEDGCG